MSCVKKWKLFHLIVCGAPGVDLALVHILARFLLQIRWVYDKITHLISSRRLRAITLILWNTCAIVTWKMGTRTRMHDTSHSEWVGVCVCVVINTMLQVNIEHILIAIHSARKWLTFLFTDVCSHWKWHTDKLDEKQHPRHDTFRIEAMRYDARTRSLTRLSNTPWSITHGVVFFFQLYIPAANSTSPAYGAQFIAIINVLLSACSWNWAHTLRSHNDRDIIICIRWSIHSSWSFLFFCSQSLSLSLWFPSIFPAIIYHYIGYLPLEIIIM